MNPWRPNCGAAAVEMALAMPIIVITLIGTIDFARVSYQAMALTNAARAGAQYGARTLGNSSDTAGIQTAAQSAAATDIGTITTVVTRTCGCSGASPTVGQCNSTCTSPLRVFVTVKASKTFHTLAHYPGIPSSLPLSRTVELRAQ